MLLAPPQPRIVPLHPAARAAAVAAVKTAVVTASLKLYLSPDGTNVRESVLDCSELVAIVMTAMEQAGCTAEDGYEEMRAALSSMIYLSEINFKLDSARAGTIDMGARIALEMFCTLAPKQVRKAWQRLNNFGV